MKAILNLLNHSNHFKNCSVTNTPLSMYCIMYNPHSQGRTCKSIFRASVRLRLRLREWLLRGVCEDSVCSFYSFFVDVIFYSLGRGDFQSSCGIIPITYALLVDCNHGLDDSSSLVVNPGE